MQIKYVFKSKRLGLRRWEMDDIPSYQELSSDPEVMKYFPKEFYLNMSKARTAVLSYNEHMDKHGFTYFAVDLLESGNFIGFIGMKTIAYDIYFAPAVDIGWRLEKKYWGRGLATEGAAAAQEWFFKTHGYDKLVSLTPVLNLASEKVMIKIGMTKIDEFRHPLIREDDPLSVHVLYEKSRQ